MGPFMVIVLKENQTIGPPEFGSNDVGITIPVEICDPQTVDAVHFNSYTVFIPDLRFGVIRAFKPADLPNSL